MEGRLEFLAAEYEEGGHVDEHAAHRQRDDEGAEQPLLLRHPFALPAAISDTWKLSPRCFAWGKFNGIFLDRVLE